MTPLWGDLVGPVPFSVPWLKGTLAGAFRIIEDDPPNPLTADFSTALAFLTRVVVRWDNADVRAPRALLAKLPAQLLRALLAAYLHEQSAPIRALHTMWETPGFRTDTQFEWRLLKSKLVGNPPPSPYLAAFVSFHLQHDEHEDILRARAQLRVQTAMYTVGTHNPKDLQRLFTQQELEEDGAFGPPSSQEEADRKAMQEQQFYQTDHIFGDKYEVPDFVLTQMAAQMQGPSNYGQ